MPALTLPAVEVQSELGGNSDGEADGEGMLVSPGPAAQPPVPPDTLPDVRSLADALEAPPSVVDLQVQTHTCLLRAPRQH